MIPRQGRESFIARLITEKNASKENAVQITPTTRQAAEDYRTARDAYFALDPDDPKVAVTEECRQARERSEHAGLLLAEMVLGELDSTD